MEPYLLPDSLQGVLAQRLVRKLCERCKEPVDDPQRAFHRLAVKPPTGQPLHLWKSRGCAACKGGGFNGRQAIFELMTLDPSFHEPILRRVGSPDFARLAREAGMMSMFDDGVRRALDGMTTLEELLRVTKSSEE